MTTRTASGSTYTLGYDEENRLTSVSGAATAAFTYDGDGNRVKSVVGATTTLFVGSHYETSGGVVTKYYLAGGTRVAMRKGSTFYWLLSDHLGSTSKVATAAGALHSQQLYKAWGESRYTSGTLPTRYTYTGQYSYAGDFGLVFYGSRFYDPLLSRWASPDSIIPQNQGTQAWDRYAYSYGNPVKYIDPSGHKPCEGENDAEGCDWKLPALLKKADALLQKNIGVDDLKAMAGIVDFAHRLCGRDWDGMAKSLSLLFLGDQVRGPGSLWTTYRSPHGPVIDFKDTGFHPDFRDYRNQVYHTWAYIVETASPNNIAEGILGGYSATVGNYVHELPLAGGSSWEDFQLAEAGIYIGWQVTTGAVSLSQLGDFILQTLGPNAPPGLTSAGRLPYSPLESWLLQDVSK